MLAETMYTKFESIYYSGLPLAGAASRPHERGAHLPGLTYDENDVAIENEGMSCRSIWFGGGRMGVHVERDGAIEEIDYFGAQPIDRRLFFKVSKHGPFEKVFCPYLLVEDRAYMLEWEHTRVFPAGYRSRMDLPGESIEIEHSLTVLDDAFIYRVRVLRNDFKHPLRLRLSLHRYDRHEASGRSWGDWTTGIADGALAAAVEDAERAGEHKTVTTWIGVVGGGSVSLRRLYSGKDQFDTASVDGENATIAVLFSSDRSAFVERAAALRENGASLVDDGLAQWESALARSPSLRIGRRDVESFFRQAGLILDALKPADLKGAMRASVGHYWVWGWDTIAYCDSELIRGGAPFVRDALDLYRRTADPELGVGHQFSETLKMTIPQALPAQGLYINMLYQYVAFTRDAQTLEEFYPFARTIFSRTLAHATGDGLITGSALWPDLPKLCGHIAEPGEVGYRDISVFNNGIFYQAAREMEHLAGLVNDRDTARTARSAWKSLEAAFRRHFWDSDRGYWVDSLEAETLDARKSYPAHALMWFSPFARDLVAGRERDCAEFLIGNHVCSGGIRPYPRWDSSFNATATSLRSGIRPVRTSAISN